MIRNCTGAQEVRRSIPGYFAGPLILWLLLSVPAGIVWAEDRIVICGSSDNQALLRALAAAFEKGQSEVRIDIPPGIGSTGGIRATASGKCDLGRVAREMEEKEKRLKLNCRTFAYSAVVFAAHPGVRGVSGITSQQIVDIYSGRTASWSALGGEGGKIYVADREEGESCRGVLERHIPGFKDIGTRAGKKLYSTDESIRAISRYKGTVGYIPMAAVQRHDLTILEVDGVYPSPENVRSGRYRFVSPFGIIWRGELRSPAKEFVDFLFSPEARKIISENGAISVQGE